MHHSYDQAPTIDAAIQVLVNATALNLAELAMNEVMDGIVGEAVHPWFQPSNPAGSELTFLYAMPTHSLAKVFLAAGSLDAGLEDDALEQTLVRICNAVRETWPDLDLQDQDFVAFLAQEHDAGELSSIDQERAADIFLARACGQGQSTALATFEAQYIGRIPAMLSHMKLSASVLDEVVQVVRMKLLVGENAEPPKIANYAKRGKLDGLVQVVATRAALSMLRKAKPHGGEEELLKLPDPAHAPGLSYMKENYREAFSACFEEAIGTLSSRDRNLLRLHLLDRVTLEQLATMYSVHRATVVRWLAKIREELFAQTRERLSSRLQIGSNDFKSLMKLIESRLDVSVRRMLQSQEAPSGQSSTD